MKETKFKIVVIEDGRIVIEEPALRKGQHIEITIRSSERPLPTWPLRGLPVVYRDPFGPAVPESEWESET